MLADEVMAVIARVRKIPPEKISLDSTFEDLGIDSLSGIAIAYELEQKYNLSIPNEEAMEIRTVRQMVEGLQQLLTQGARNAAAPGETGS